MIHRKPSHSGRAGLTLMELVVVLVVLIALAGIVVPMLPNLLTNAHDATVTTNVTGVNQAIQGYFAVNLKYPDQFDSLVDTNGNIYVGCIWAPGNQFSSLTFTPISGTGVPPANGTTALSVRRSASGRGFQFAVGRHQ